MIARTHLAVMLAALSLAPTFAQAADLGPYRPPAPEPDLAPPADYAPMRYNWSGLYFGVNGGYGWGASPDGAAASDAEGALGGLTLGYNAQMGGLLLGLEGDIGLMDVAADDGDAVSKYGPWWGTIRARAGITLDRTLFYATAGVAFAELDTASFGTAGETSWSDDVDTGLAVGGGIEHALTQNISLKVEYLHMDFGDSETYVAGSGSTSVDNDVDVVRAGLNFKF